MNIYLVKSWGKVFLDCPQILDCIDPAHRVEAMLSPLHHVKQLKNLIICCSKNKLLTVWACIHSFAPLVIHCALGNSSEQDRPTIYFQEFIGFSGQTDNEHIIDAMSLIQGNILGALGTGTHEGVSYFWSWPWNCVMQLRKMSTRKCIYVYTHTRDMYMYILCNFTFLISTFMRK